MFIVHNIGRGFGAVKCITNVWSRALDGKRFLESNVSSIQEPILG